MKIQFLFAWYDLWIGFFYDKNKNWIYILPLPMMGIIIKFPERKVKNLNIADVMCCFNCGHELTPTNFEDKFCSACGEDLLNRHEPIKKWKYLAIKKILDTKDETLIQKNDNISDISNQRHLLIAFLKSYRNCNLNKDDFYKIDDFINRTKSN